MNWFFKLLIFPLSFALALDPCLAQTRGNVLRGANSVSFLIEKFDKDSITSDVSRGSISGAIKYPFSSARFKLVEPTSDSIIFYVNITTLHFQQDNFCVSNIQVSAYYDQTVKLEFSDRSVFADITLWEEEVIISSQRSDHEQRVSQSIEDLAKQFVTAWNLDNKAGEFDDLIPGFTPKKKALPGWATEPPGAKTEPRIPPGWTTEPPATRPATTGSNPAAVSAVAESTVPGGGTESEVVTVKYRGPVSLAPFKCDAITRSSFIERVCYDAANSYMLIDLNGTWYHYCEIDAGTVSNLMAAESMGRFYNASIKGRFDCRTHHVPQY